MDGHDKMARFMCLEKGFFEFIREPLSDLEKPFPSALNGFRHWKHLIPEALLALLLANVGLMFVWNKKEWKRRSTLETTMSVISFFCRKAENLALRGVALVTPCDHQFQQFVAEKWVIWPKLFLSYEWNGNELGSPSKNIDFKMSNTSGGGVIVYVNEAICMRKIAALNEFHGFAPANLRWISIYEWLILHKVI